MLSGFGGSKDSREHERGPERGPSPTQARAVAAELLTIVEGYQGDHPGESPAPVHSTWVVLDLALLLVPLVAVILAVLL